MWETGMESRFYHCCLNTADYWEERNFIIPYVQIMNMNFVYKRAGMEDIELLVKTRIEVLRAANCLSDSAEMPLVEQQSREYYEECLRAETHIAYLVFDGEKFIGAGGVSFFRVMPTYHNPTGWKAYIMNSNFAL